MFLRFRITSELPTLLLVIDRERLSEALSGETGAEEFSSVTIESPRRYVESLVRLVIALGQ